MLYPESTVGLPHITSWLAFSQAAMKIVEATSSELNEAEKLRALIEQNVLVQIQHLKTHPYVAARLAAGRVNLHAWVYDIETGGVVVYDDEHGAFVPIEEAVAVAQTV